jgi:hypothetical protein
MTDDPVVTWEDVADDVLVVTLDRRPANATAFLEKRPPKFG